MSIRFNQPKYILPLIATPFVFFIFHINRGLFAADEAQQGQQVLQQREEFNPDMPSANLDKKDIKSKFDSFKDRFKKREDYTAMLGIEEEEAEEEPTESLYSEEEKRVIDSIGAAIMDGKERDFMTSVRQRNQNDPSPGHPAQRNTLSGKRNESQHEREMRLFREQMLLLDSLTRSSEQEPFAQRTAMQNEQDISMSGRMPPSVDTPDEGGRQEALVQVRKAGSNAMASYFNTVAAEAKEQFIRAILDESLKVVDGSRVRIRLMDDIQAAHYLIEKGTYLFGTVQSFSEQRIHIHVTSILIDEQVLPVDLRVYDNDGLPGLYVPHSNFRDLAKELAANVSSGSNVQLSQDPQQRNQFFYGIAQRALQSATRAAGKAARRNKAFLKYNTIVYLVSPEDLKP